MGLFTINITAKVNQPPSAIGDNSVQVTNDTTYTFTKDDFTVDTVPPYADPDGDDVDKVKITSLLSPGTGDLEYNAIAVTLDQEVAMTGIVTGLLKYIADPGSPAAYSETFTFDMSDLGTNTFSGLTGTMTINVEDYVNQPPTTGDNSASIAHAATHTFTSAEFTSATTPAYSDPEGDSAERLRVNDLPANGTLKLNGAPVVAGQIITFTDIAAGNFTYDSDINYTSARAVDFDFDISDDSGSGTFST